MKNIKSILPKLFESKDMQSYLAENIDTLSKQQIIEMIAGSRLTLEEKLQVFTSLKDETSESPSCELSYAECAGCISFALEALKLKTGELFLCRECDTIDNENYDSDFVLPNHEDSLYEGEPFFSVDAVLKSIHKKNEISPDLLWHRLEKWVTDENDNLIHVINYDLFPTGEIVYFEVVNVAYKDLGITEQYFHHSIHLNLPVPFQVGDIITIDLRPYMLNPFHALITEIGDNKNVASPTCTFASKKEIKENVPVKNAQAFESKDTYVRVSALYRAEIFNGILPEHETILLELQRALRTGTGGTTK